MYYDEKMIDGILHWRGTPNGEWRPLTVEMLTRKLTESRAQYERLSNLVTKLREMNAKYMPNMFAKERAKIVEEMSTI